MIASEDDHEELLPAKSLRLRSFPSVSATSQGSFDLKRLGEIIGDHGRDSFGERASFGTLLSTRQDGEGGFSTSSPVMRLAPIRQSRRHLPPEEVRHQSTEAAQDVVKTSPHGYRWAPGRRPIGDHGPVGQLVGAIGDPANAESS